MTNDLDDKSKPSQQLVMTPQLQLAIKMLSTPSAELAALIASTQGLEPAELGDLDLLQVPSDEELELQVETGVTPWSFLLERPPELAASDADVWIFGNPPIARANRAAWPHVRGATRDAAWVVRALRQRAKLFEQVVTAILQARPELAVARGADQAGLGSGDLRAPHDPRGDDAARGVGVLHPEPPRCVPLRRHQARRDDICEHAPVKWRTRS